MHGSDLQGSLEAESPDLMSSHSGPLNRDVEMGMSASLSCDSFDSVTHIDHC